MASEPDNLGGRREADRVAGALSAETLGYLLGDLKEDMAELKVMMREGFAEARQRHGEHGKRIAALESFRTRVETRDAAVAKAEGSFTIRLPMLALILTSVGLIAGVVIAISQHT